MTAKVIEFRKKRTQPEPPEREIRFVCPCGAYHGVLSALGNDLIYTCSNCARRVTIIDTIVRGPEEPTE